MSTIIEKYPIEINGGTIILLTIYKTQERFLDNCIEDMIVGDASEYIIEQPERGAKEFIKQLRGTASPRFLQCLMNECAEELDKINKRELV